MTPLVALAWACEFVTVPPAGPDLSGDPPPESAPREPARVWALLVWASCACAASGWLACAAGPTPIARAANAAGPAARRRRGFMGMTFRAGEWAGSLSRLIIGGNNVGSDAERCPIFRPPRGGARLPAPL